MARYFSGNEEERNCLSTGVDGGWDEGLHVLQPVHNSRILETGEEKKYYGYYCSPRGSSVGLAFSNDLVSWSKYSDNPILESTDSRVYRWPSVCFHDDKYMMFVTDTIEKKLERWVSEDGINFNFKEKVADGTMFFNPFVWRNPVDEQWYLFCHLGSGEDSRIAYLKSSSPTSFSSSEFKEILSCPERWRNIASPSIMYKNGYYWLTVEYKEPSTRFSWVLRSYFGSSDKITRMIDKLGLGGIWKTAVFYSKDIDKGYSKSESSPILDPSSACAMQFIRSDSDIYLFYNKNEDRWRQHLQVLSS